VRVVFVGRNRVIWRRLLLYVVTLGISRRVWLYRINKELDGHEALALRHGLNLFLLCLPVVGPTVVTFQTARRTRLMLAGSGIPYGPAPLVWAATLVPILGNLFFIAWEQSRLNRFWAQERGSTAHGIEVDIDLSQDPGFVVELGRAMRESYYAASRFDTRKNARRARWQARAERLRTARAARLAVREAGGSTPVLPWLHPKRPALRVLHITCGRCQAAFDVNQDPTVDTPVVCPNCGLTEVLPSLRADPLALRQPATIPTLKVACPQCGTKFQVVRNLHGPTPIKCPACGRADELPAPGAQGESGKPAKKGKAKAAA
jgi:predicted nucleic acid-binding Zn ribbon protein